jgi:hypothetical protein
MRVFAGPITRTQERSQPLNRRHPKRKKPAPKSGLLLCICRRSPNLPHTFACSTIGPARLNFRVRDGNGWDPRGMVTGKLRRLAGV